MKFLRWIKEHALMVGTLVGAFAALLSAVTYAIVEAREAWIDSQGPQIRVTEDALTPWTMPEPLKEIEANRVFDVERAEELALDACREIESPEARRDVDERIRALAKSGRRKLDDALPSATQRLSFRMENVGEEHYSHIEWIGKEPLLATARYNGGPVALKPAEPGSTGIPLGALKVGETMDVEVVVGGRSLYPDYHESTLLATYPNGNTKGLPIRVGRNPRNVLVLLFLFGMLCWLLGWVGQAIVIVFASRSTRKRLQGELTNAGA